MLRPNFTIPALTAVLGALALAPAANAEIKEVGPTGAAATGTPSCPTNCIAVTRTTGYQQSVGGTNGVFRVPADGRIVAWSVQLGLPGKKQVKFFNDNYGGEAQAGLAVLTTGTKARARLVAQSPVMKLTPFFGKTVQFPLETTLAVKKDEVIALTVPTWAPALAVGLPADTAWRASRDSACKAQATTQTQTAQTTIGDLKQYLCKYTTARLTYSATLVTNPTTPAEDQ
ncbi:hypothetical protein [Capillimicrobium parvum]|uniref:Uncharacterized protein n=1 Tax=Capillimicrobium parvum TaxID=2884022 RepID=A0A9E6Y0F5_9ACTN|nr:hypothetical protein [Capillimicrobium parvum]UGS37661.1 hypothetical protein DSM104329_04081 [Capillimicrobium parvum]